MRILCLHGMGTNSQIFEAQTALLRASVIAELNTECEFVFVDGEIETEPRNGVEKYYDGPFLSYYDWDSATSLRNAYQLIDELIDEQGPFDGIMGFSQGGSLATSFLLYHMATCPSEPVELLFRFAIIICSGNPFDARGPKTRRYHPNEDMRRIPIPTAHIVGRKDDEHPRQLLLHRLCDNRRATVYDHGGGHEIPRHPSAVKGMSDAICRAIDQAYLL
ncbi:DUF341 domain protein [Penicillium paradoxum]|uniref:DUF341 domain protein n=1 Tax=Penicillium paradoxum TaxID=176176 RepID=UPI0025479DAB|nr:DUF341 domain protein [Penicillium paradoxum]KAJ5794583.1 DUF341 domain protein [Penicillium paradoxum]